jgi:DNA polymerase-4
MDAFYASVEARDDPSLRGRPLIVGGTGNRGVVASCSYEARVFGVRSAMPSTHARRLCPQAVFLPGRFGRYAEVSREMHAIFQRYTPLVEGISLDEAFLDVTGAIRLFGPPARIGSDIRAAVAAELGLSCSVGGATVKFLAKLASEAAKPRVDRAGSRQGPGVFIVEGGRELDFLHPHPIEALWGVGPATAGRLRQLGITTIGDLAVVAPEVLEGVVGRANGAHLARLARGVDERAVEPQREVKSISHEETYATDRRDPEGLRVEVLRMADAVSTRMRRAGLAGRTVTLKVRHGDFSTRTRSVTAAVPTDDGPEIGRLGAELLAGVDLAGGIRLLGVGVSNLMPADDGAAEQLSLDLAGDGPGPSRVTASTSAAVDAIRRRFGSGAVGPAAFLSPDGLRVKQPGETQWGPPR